MGKRFLTLALCGVMLLCGCGAKSATPLPQPDFPLTEETLLDTLRFWPGLEVSDSLTNTVDGVTSTVYMLRKEGAENDLNSIIVTSYTSEETGRVLTLRQMEYDKDWLRVQTDPTFDDYQMQCMAMEHLYGGFSSQGVLFAAICNQKMPDEAGVLWEGAVDGAYFVVTSREPMKPERLAKGNSLTFQLYGSGEKYQDFLQRAQEVPQQ